MAIITVQEIVDLVIMILAIGFIFKDMLRVPKKEYDPLKEFAQKKPVFGEGFRNAIIIAAPAIILHEAGHKVVAMLFGFEATFHAAYTWLGIGIILKVIGAPFLFFIPGYVEYSGTSDAVTIAIVAAAGPLMNLALFFFASFALKYKLYEKYTPHLILMKQINIFLFFFNLIPIGIFDGNDVLRGILFLVGIHI